MCPRRSRVRRQTAAGSTDATTVAPPHGNDRAARNYAPGKRGIIRSWSRAYNNIIVVIVCHDVKINIIYRIDSVVRPISRPTRRCTTQIFKRPSTTDQLKHDGDPTCGQNRGSPLSLFKRFVVDFVASTAPLGTVKRRQVPNTVIRPLRSETRSYILFVLQYILYLLLSRYDLCR